MRGIVWFKKDLRTLDHPALTAACERCADGLVAVYCLDYELWRKHHTASCQIEFIFRGLAELKSDLAELHIPLRIIAVEKTDELPQKLWQLADELQAEALFFNRELEWNEKKREEKVSQQFLQKGLRVESYADQFIFPWDDFYAARKTYFKIFTPFKNYWHAQFKPAYCKLLNKPKIKQPILLAASVIPPVPKHFQSNIPAKIRPAGEKAAQKILRRFIQTQLSHYDETRDFPAVAGTSQLSPYLALGMLSAKTCFAAALKENHYEHASGNPGALMWMSELLWREFYRHLLVAVPRICMNQAYQTATEKLPWRYEPSWLQAWQQGQTGFPIVDAGMRELNTTGWMHNRLRMITAMFLAKNLFLDWRLGEKYFTEKLIDLDFASNNGGWQWCASTGTDAVPYFRIFNPTTQSERFDPEGQYIRRYCPELAGLDNKAIHAPYLYAPQVAEKTGYPRPIIDYAASRAFCLQMFKKLKGIKHFN